MDRTKKAPIQFESQTPATNCPGVFDIEAKDLAANAEKVHIVDVRQPEEYTGELGHIASAQLMVLDTVPDQLHKLPKDEPIIFVCLAGGRSLRAAAFAASQGFQHVFNLKGGMKNWSQLALPVER
jgi:hydroxyacylglutathione hydrolase